MGISISKVENFFNLLQIEFDIGTMSGASSFVLYLFKENDIYKEYKIYRKQDITSIANVSPLQLDSEDSSLLNKRQGVSACRLEEIRGDKSRVGNLEICKLSALPSNDCVQSGVLQSNVSPPKIVLAERKNPFIEKLINSQVHILDAISEDEEGECKESKDDFSKNVKFQDLNSNHGKSSFNVYSDSPFLFEPSIIPVITEVIARVRQIGLPEETYIFGSDVSTQPNPILNEHKTTFFEPMVKEVFFNELAAPETSSEAFKWFNNIPNEPFKANEELTTEICEACRGLNPDDDESISPSREIFSEIIAPLADDFDLSSVRFVLRFTSPKKCKNNINLECNLTPEEKKSTLELDENNAQAIENFSPKFSPEYINSNSKTNMFSESIFQSQTHNNSSETTKNQEKIAISPIIMTPQKNFSNSIDCSEKPDEINSTVQLNPMEQTTNTQKSVLLSPTKSRLAPQFTFGEVQLLANISSPERNPPVLPCKVLPNLEVFDTSPALDLDEDHDQMVPINIEQTTAIEQIPGSFDHPTVVPFNPNLCIPPLYRNIRAVSSILYISDTTYFENKNDQTDCEYEVFNNDFNLQKLSAEHELLFSQIPEKEINVFNAGNTPTLSPYFEVKEELTKVIELSQISFPLFKDSINTTNPKRVKASTMISSLLDIKKSISNYRSKLTTFLTLDNDLLELVKPVRQLSEYNDVLVTPHRQLNKTKESLKVEMERIVEPSSQISRFSTGGGMKALLERSTNIMESSYTPKQSDKRFAGFSNFSGQENYTKKDFSKTKQIHRHSRQGSDILKSISNRFPGLNERLNHF
jgi:hypothetical protein